MSIVSTIREIQLAWYRMYEPTDEEIMKTLKFYSNSCDHDMDLTIGRCKNMCGARYDPYGLLSSDEFGKILNLGEKSIKKLSVNGVCILKQFDIFAYRGD